MNCNYVFNILTRGPFPSGESTDAAVELHLATCWSCRRLAEALRPALEVLQESIAPEECGSLPGYWGELSPAPREICVATTSRTKSARPSRRSVKAPAAIVRELRGISPWQVALAAACGLVLGVVLRSSPVPSQNPSESSPTKTEQSVAPRSLPNHGGEKSQRLSFQEKQAVK